MRLNQITVGCSDYQQSVKFYKLLGLTQIVDAPPRYARFETPTGETLSIHAAEQMGGSATVIYFEDHQLDETVTSLEAKGVKFDTQPTDENWGWREARLRDPAGNALCLFYAGDNRRFPPWRIDAQTKSEGTKK